MKDLSLEEARVLQQISELKRSNDSLLRSVQRLRSSEEDVELDGLRRAFADDLEAELRLTSARGATREQALQKLVARLWLRGDKAAAAGAGAAKRFVLLATLGRWRRACFRGRRAELLQHHAARQAVPALLEPREGRGRPGGEDDSARRNADAAQLQARLLEVQAERGELAAAY
ncbi:hypothetical protein M885DRAFT_561615, partial [Pelagophyceae sp. CCMP2097]